MLAMAVALFASYSVATSGATAQTHARTLIPVADTYVTSAYPSTGFGARTNLDVASYPSTRTYLRFDVRAVTTTVTKATLRVYAPVSHPGGFQVRPVASTTWAEATTTWLNSPTVSSTVTGSSGPLTAGRWVTIDVTTLVRANSLVSMSLLPAGGALLSLRSRESGATAAQLVVESASASPTPSPVPTSTPTPTPTPAPSPTATTATTNAYYVAPTGSDSNPGTQAAPFRTFTYALTRLGPGKTLYARGGIYSERVVLSGSTLTPGTASQRVTVRNVPGERPIIKGLLWLSNASYWTIDGINVTWDTATGQPDEHMVKFYGGVGWAYRNAEVWGAHSYSGILVMGSASGWSLNHLYVHDTYATNGASQDHLIYVSTSGQGVIEYNLLVNSPNGRGIKLGNTDPGAGLPTNVTVRYNTIVNSGASNVSLSYDANGSNIHHNVLVSAGTNYANIGAYQLTGGGNVASQNIAWNGVSAIVPGTPITDAGGNVVLNPQLNANYKPQSATLYNASGVLLYGHRAGETISTP